jgi:hypothetical protein
MSISPNFRGARVFLGPSWLTAEEGQLVGYSLDVMKDCFAERLLRGHLARFPQNGPNGQVAPDDALAAMGRDRQVVRGINESSQSYASRLIKWLDARQTTGNPFALMQKLSEYTGPLCSFRTVDYTGNWFSRAVGGAQSVNLYNPNVGSNWDWDGNATAGQWSRFWVIIYPNGLWTQWQWGDSGIHWGDPNLTWGSTATPDQIATVKAIVADWKPAGTKCVNIILAFDPTSFNPTGARDSAGLPDGSWPNWGKQSSGVEVPARLTTACYWDGP